MCSMLTIGLLLFIAVPAYGFKQHCRETLNKGRENVETVAEHLAAKEFERIAAVLAKSKLIMREFSHESISHSSTFQDLIRVRDGQQPCPQPNATMFTDSTVPQPTTKHITTPKPTQAQTTDGASTSGFRPPTVYAATHEEDPFAQHMANLHHYMSREDEVCNNELKDINSITEDQLYGFFSTLAAAHPGPFCSLCHRFTEEIQFRLFKPVQLLTTDDEFHFNDLLFSHVPAARDICSAIAPGCHEDYISKVANLTESVVCLECTACMSITNVIQHKFLLQPKVIESAVTFLRGNLFHNLCAELCITFQNQNQTVDLFPNGFSYEGCLNVMEKKFRQIIKVATVILRPERLCSLELQWCELNEQPNIIHCLREMCFEYFKDTPQTRWFCSQIPDRPEQADQFLNIRQTKVYKDKKDYHNKFQNRNLHDEL
ncbi:unnamed protein product [Caenorhabditis bovis]|uniref:Saposin B-type domain-containing protein n=1 Tax=Caenorhabditis bovis TaxID=2654633 RepID=A0A8S1F3C2_9PELO|nr:unnamed protein product [Caenorhabditis bovis]